VHQAAARLNVSSRRLLVYLDSHGMPHATATSALSPAAAALLDQVTTTQILVESARHHRHRPLRRPTFWFWEADDDSWEWGWDERTWRNWDGPDELTTTEAAWAYAVTPATIRQWVHRGHLVPLRRQGRTLIFEAHAVYSAAMATGDRNNQPGGPLTRDHRRAVEPAGRHISGQAMSGLVTAEAAASALRLSASTIRSWRHRGLLTPARHQGRTPLYLLADVVATARRSPHHSPRKERPVF
jgi:DNA-binding transcriptional MerR regulator